MKLIILIISIISMPVYADSVIRFKNSSQAKEFDLTFKNGKDTFNVPDFSAGTTIPYTCILEIYNHSEIRVVFKDKLYIKKNDAELSLLPLGIYTVEIDIEEFDEPIIIGKEMTYGRVLEKIVLEKKLYKPASC